jgi:hypothetical protein
VPDRFPALFLLEQIGDNIAARAQAHLVALDLGDEAAGDVMMFLLVRDPAVGPDQLDAVVLDAVEGTGRDPDGWTLSDLLRRREE